VVQLNYKTFWEELTAYFPLIRYGPHRKRKKLGGYTGTLTYRQQGDLISLLLFFQSKESGIEMKIGKQYVNNQWSRDSSVSTVTGYGLDLRGIGD
jgi:hypothetical protein